MKDGGDIERQAKAQESEDSVYDLFKDVTEQYLDEPGPALDLDKGAEPIVEELDFNWILQEDYGVKEDAGKTGGAGQPSEKKTETGLGETKGQGKKDLERSFQEANDRREMHQFEELIKGSSGRKEPVQVDAKNLELKVKSGILWSSCKEVKAQFEKQEWPELTELMGVFEDMYNSSSRVERSGQEVKKVRRVAMDADKRNGFLSVNDDLKCVMEKITTDEKKLNSVDWSKGMQAMKKLLAPLVVTSEEEEVIIEFGTKSQTAISVMVWVTDGGNKHILANGVVPLEHHSTVYYLVLLRLFGEKTNELKRHINTSVLNQLVALEGLLKTEPEVTQRMQDKRGKASEGPDILDVVYKKQDEALNDPVSLMNLKNNEILALTEKLMRRNPSVMQVNMLVIYQKMDLHLAMKGLKEILAGFYQLSKNFLERLEDFDMKIVRLKMGEEHYQTRIYVHSKLLKKNEKKELITLDYYSLESLMFAERITLLFLIYKEGLGNYTVKTFLLFLSNQATKNELTHQPARKLDEHNNDTSSNKAHSNNKDINYDKISNVPQAIAKNTITTLFSANQPETSPVAPETDLNRRITTIEEIPALKADKIKKQQKVPEPLDDSLEIIEATLGKRHLRRERSRSKEKARARDSYVECVDIEQSPRELSNDNFGNTKRIAFQEPIVSPTKAVRSRPFNFEKLMTEKQPRMHVEIVEDEIEEERQPKVTVVEKRQNRTEAAQGKKQYSGKGEAQDKEDPRMKNQIVPESLKFQQSTRVKSSSEAISKAAMVSKKVGSKSKPKKQEVDNSSDSIEIEEARTGMGRKTFYNEEFFKRIECAVKLKDKLKSKLNIK